MIKINELRIGNYLSLLGEPFKVSEIRNALQEVELCRPDKQNPKTNEYEECDLDCEDLAPIELTEKMLLKFGFNTDYKKGYIGKDPEEACACDFVLSYPYRMGEWQTYFAWEFDNYKFQKLEYVHELQNLYFALTGSELVFSTEP
jgi:hypothetical protein